MPFSSGVYTLPNPALVTGEVVSATENNTTRNDLAGALNLTMLRNGTSTATANLPMGGYKLTGLGAPNANGDSLAYGAAAVVTTLTSTSLTATRVPYAGTGGLLQDTSTFTFDGTTLTAGGFSTSGNISAATATVSGNITVSGGTANGVAYLNGSKVLTTGSALTFDGSKLGIGTASPGYKLVAYTTGATNVIASMSDAGQTAYLSACGNGTAPGSTAFDLFQSGAGDSYIYNRSNGFMAFGVNNTEGMRLTSTGLGIGTSSPGYKLTVEGYIAARSGNGITFLNAANNSTSAINNTAASGSSNLYFATPSGNMTLDSSGNLGLGVTPSTGTGWTSQIEMVSGANVVSQGTDISLGQNYYYNSGYKYKANGYAAQYLVYNGAHLWYTAPSGTAGNAISFTQAMTLDASGNLGIGMTPVGNGVLELNAAAGNNTSLAFYQAGSGKWLLGNTNSSNALRFYDLSAGSERMRIDSSGNVGIGTSSPTGKLTVNGNSIVQQGGTDQLRFYTEAGASYIDSINNTTLRVGTSGAYSLLFATNGSERMRIDSSGNLLVGTTNTINGALINFYKASGTIETSLGGTTAAQNHIVFANPNGNVGSIQVSGSATSFNTSSDYRLKENIKPMQGALAVVQQLNPVTYTWKADGSDGQGFIAHELQAVVPDCVTGEKDAVDEEGKPVYQGIDTSFLVATLTAAIKELKAELDATKAEVAALKGV